jgi:hypothetical protein
MQALSFKKGILISFSILVLINILGCRNVKWTRFEYYNRSDTTENTCYNNGRNT